MDIGIFIPQVAFSYVRKVRGADSVARMPFGVLWKLDIVASSLELPCAVCAKVAANNTVSNIVAVIDIMTPRESKVLFISHS
jgi:hypothetical protein